MVDESATELDRRFPALAAMVPPGSRVADIGTDAARLPRILLRSGRARHCIASDITDKGLELARQRRRDDLEAGRLELRRASGLSALSREDRIEVLVLSGLGAHKIVRILGQDRPRSLDVRRLVLQPQTEAVLVRRWLLEHAYVIVEETMVRERKSDYVIIAAEARSEAGDSWRGPLALEDLLEAGPRLIHSADRLVREHWIREERRLERIVAARANRRTTDETVARLGLARRVLACLAGRG